MSDKKRNCKLDNLKAILIFFVVFGHLLECFDGTMRLWLYFVIYSFHMPAFIYVTGYFSKFDPERLIKKLGYSYLVYQFLYLMFQRHYLLQENQIQFTQPYWLLWYLVSLICWILLIPVIDWAGVNRKTVLGMVFVCALLTGYDKSVGYYLSLSRSVVLFPFFVLGHYRIMGREQMKHGKAGMIISVAVIIISMFYLRNNLTEIQGNWLYHSVPYNGTFSIVSRAAIFCVALAWIFLLLRLVPDKEVPLLTDIGKYTLTIFLCHGFIVKWIAKVGLFQWIQVGDIFVAVILSVIICLCFGNKIVTRILSFTFSIDWRTWFRVDNVK